MHTQMMQCSLLLSSDYNQTNCPPRCHVMSYSVLDVFAALTYYSGGDGSNGADSKSFRDVSAILQQWGCSMPEVLYVLNGCCCNCMFVYIRCCCGVCVCFFVWRYNAVPPAAIAMAQRARQQQARRTILPSSLPLSFLSFSSCPLPS